MRQQRVMGMAIAVNSALASEVAFSLSVSTFAASVEPVGASLYPNTCSDRRPTMGGANDDRVVSNALSNAYMLVRDLSGTISAKIGLRESHKGEVHD